MTAPQTVPPTSPPSARAHAETLLSQVAVADEVEQASYDRDRFEHWIDADGNGCNTRCEVLLRQQLPGGGWFSVYDRTNVANSSDLDVDHVVALAEAWRSGAWAWDANRRRDFANDLAEPRSLVAVSGSSNRSKSDRDPTGWRPAAEQDWCDYAISWMTVKLRWSLAVDPEEFIALQHLTERC
ncbi:MAG: HNH endonuclease family protein [Actinomycetota bacterium]|nr:HNH endonuclease family protein [Actinomycetota bacterium]